jgi:hypothetical protein
MNVGVKAEKWVVGETASIAITHKYIRPDRLGISWVRCGPTFQKVVALDTPDYVLTPEDTTFSIRVVATPFDEQRKRLPSVSSPNSPIIHTNELISPELVGLFVEGEQVTFDCSEPVISAEWFRGDQVISSELTYVCTNKDVGWNLRAELKLAKAGIVVGASAPRPVAPCVPSVEISFPRATVTEGELIKPNVVYHGGVEGKSTTRWFRENIKPNLDPESMDDPDSQALIDQEPWKLVHQGIEYQTSMEDADCRLQFSYTPMRNDGTTGAMQTLEIGPVESKSPRVKDVIISQNEHGFLAVKGSYRGGREGHSFFVWRAHEDDLAEPRKLGKTVDKALAPGPEVIGKVVDCVYVPVREDGLAGTPVASQNKIKVAALPSVTSAEILVKGGTLTVGALCHCRSVVSKGAKPTFQWRRGDGKKWVDIPGANHVEFTPTEADLGFMIRCNVVAVNSKGWCSASLHTAATAKVRAPHRSFAILYPGETSDDAFTPTEPQSLVTGTVLNTNAPQSRQKPAPVQWQREEDGSWVDVTTTNDYLLTADDVGKRIRVTARGERITNPTKPVELAPAVLTRSKTIAKAPAFRFKATHQLSGTLWTITGTPEGLVMKSSQGTVRTARWNSVRCECVIGTRDEMVLHTDQSSKFPLVPDLSDDRRLEGLLGPSHIRDFVVATIRGLAEFHSK